MRRFPPLLRLRQLIGSHYPETLNSTLNPNTNFLRQVLPTSPPEIYSSSRCFINPFPAFSRAISSSSSPANVIHVGSDEGFNTALKKAKDEKLPSIFYFTAAWCGPCRLLSPVVEQLSKEYPHITTYKLDVDQESLTDTLSELQISSVPTILFFHNGEKVSELLGADVAKLKSTMDILYK